MSSNASNPPKVNDFDKGSVKTWPVMESHVEDAVYAKDHIFGKFIVCAICREYHPNSFEGKREGKIMAREPYWVAYFNDHVNRSSSHTIAVARKKYIEDEEAKSGGVKRNNPQQQQLSFAKKPKTLKGHTAAEEASSYTEMALLEPKRPTKFYLRYPDSTLCRGILAQQDLDDDHIQKGLECETQYYMERQLYDNQKFEGFDIRSLFSKKCTNSDVK